MLLFVSVDENLCTLVFSSVHRYLCPVTSILNYVGKNIFHNLGLYFCTVSKFFMVCSNSAS